MKHNCNETTMIGIYENDVLIGNLFVRNTDIEITYTEDMANVKMFLHETLPKPISFVPVNVCISTTNDPLCEFAGDFLNLGCHSFSIKMKDCRFSAINNEIVVCCKTKDLDFDVHRPIMKRVKRIYENGKPN